MQELDIPFQSLPILLLYLNMGVVREYFCFQCKLVNSIANLVKFFINLVNLSSNLVNLIRNLVIFTTNLVKPLFSHQKYLLQKQETTIMVSII